MKITFKSKRGIKLVGILENEKAKKCVILVHGFMDDKDGYGRWTELSSALQKENYAVFRFDFGESGESDAAEISLEGQLQDLQAAIELMKEKYSSIALVGHSLGGLCSLKKANEVNCVVSWAGTTQGNNPDWIKEIKKVNNHFEIVEAGRIYKISEKYPEERESLDPEEIIGPIKVPILLIHGTNDRDVPIEQTFNAEKYIKNGRIKIIQGEDHRFKKFRAETIASTLDFIKHYL